MIAVALILCAFGVWYVIYKDIKKRNEEKRMLKILANKVPVIHISDYGDVEKINHLKQYTEYLDSAAKQQIITEDEYQKQLASVDLQLNELEEKYLENEK